MILINAVITALIIPVLAVGAIAADATTPDPDPDPAEKCGGHQHRHAAAQHHRWTKKVLARNYFLRAKHRRIHAHYFRCAASEQDKSAIARRWRKVKRTITPPLAATFIRIARCEQPGYGLFGVNWSVTGPTYQGGMGFWYGTWAQFRYPGMPSNAGYATWRQQMKVAYRLYRLYGLSPWGCGG